MTTSNLTMSLTLTAMWTILMMSMLAKSAGMLCLLLTTYSITASLTIATKIKLTLIPFIMTLTVSGGLAIMFLYFTASMDSLKENQDHKSMKMLTNIMIVMTPLMAFSSLESNYKSNSTMKPSTDPAALLFTSGPSPMTLLMIMMLGIMLMTILTACSKSSSPMRKKKETW